MNPRNVLNELKWHPKKTIKDCFVTYIHRGATSDKKTISGKDIIRLENSFFIIKTDEEETHIPYHRILEIREKNIVIWVKK